MKVVQLHELTPKQFLNPSPTPKIAVSRPPNIDIRLKICKIRLNSDSFMAKNQTKFRLI